MAKKSALITALLLILFTLSACGETKNVYCDNCSTQISIDADSDMNDEWIIYCEPCSEELMGGEDLIGDEVLPEIPTAE